MMEILNVIAAILSVVTSIYLLVLASKAAGELKTSLFLIAFGTIIALAVHSLFELLETYQLVNIKLLTTIMPIFVTIGSLLLLIGTYFLYKIVVTGGAISSTNK